MKLTGATDHAGRSSARHRRHVGPARRRTTDDQPCRSAATLGDEIDRAGGDVVAGDCHLANTAITEQTGRGGRAIRCR